MMHSKQGITTSGVQILNSVIYFLNFTIGKKKTHSKVTVGQTKL